MCRNTLVHIAKAFLQTTASLFKLQSIKLGEKVVAHNPIWYGKGYASALFYAMLLVYRLKRQLFLNASLPLLVHLWLVSMAGQAIWNASCVHRHMQSNKIPVNSKCFKVTCLSLIETVLDVNSFNTGVLMQSSYRYEDVGAKCMKYGFKLL